MDMQNRFQNLSVAQQTNFLKEGEFLLLNTDEKVTFITETINTNLSSKVMATMLKILRELNYTNYSFYKKFIYHADSSVANAAKKALEEKNKANNETQKLLESLKYQPFDGKLEIIRNLLTSGKQLSEKSLIELLNIDDVKLRRYIIENVFSESYLNDHKLAEGLKNAIWYVRAAIIDILARRNSQVILDVADHLINDKNVDVKLKFIEALSKLDRDKAKPYLSMLLTDPIIWVRKEAEKIIAKI
jgi:hypothetical protein